MNFIAILSYNRYRNDIQMILTVNGTLKKLYKGLIFFQVFHYGAFKFNSEA